MKHILYVWVLAAAFIVAACGGKQQQQVVEQRAQLVETAPLAMSDISRELEFSTTLQGWQTLNVSPSITGKIEHIYVEVGTNVAAGANLVRMDQNQYTNTKLTYTNLGVEMQRMESLRESGAVSQQVYDQTRLSYEQTKESLEFLEKNTFVKAPFAGVISAKNYEDGELYSGQPILVLTQIYTLKALIAIPESYYPNVKKGMAVTLTSEIYPGETFPATIDIVYPTVDPASHTFQARLRIPNSGLRLRPGMYVRTKMSMGMARAMVVPYQAVLKLTGSNDRYVFLDEGGTAKRVFVTLGQRFDENIEVISDELHEGDRLVVVGQAKLVDGSKLNVAGDNAQ
ncbi:MAG: efflux RND transporter periplasmic adaptor subunit [Bacteroidales bacterium]|jgi:RND family efflux transporter MFP subunit|nr:efflux RND transporter periplasmic adaptor subunit [Bacteroidales bacterium]MBQ4221268.1 efflux RND transporter periplasmic adaptor subunit [Bacteroidales bacterium]MBQ5435313.1 efflux RND transporter periplasmic adaptor subunit [Bacteroidales bacterium]MBQ5517474.1 efflux RND transporter periplasmic adaptor subunit [Bacteroidales bacterium]MBQ5529126.1 efflux RND transporter periplasmic adaptor subunit [Bacteroidales bacterium]